MRVVPVAIVLWAVLFYGVSGLAAATSPCVSLRWWGPHEVKAGWYGNVKCVHGHVVDER